MAELGYRTFDEMVGQRQMLDQDRLAHRPRPRGSTFRSCSSSRPVAGGHDPPQRLAGPRARKCARPPPDRRLRRDAIERGKHVRLDLSDPQFRSFDRRDAVGRHRDPIYGHAGLRDDTIHIKFKGTAGQSFGAFLAKGVTSSSRARPTTMSARACRAAASSSTRRKRRRI
jgi:glutamate synthase (NADPH/NADH) large chain